MERFVKKLIGKMTLFRHSVPFPRLSPYLNIDRPSIIQSGSCSQGAGDVSINEYDRFCLIRKRFGPVKKLDLIGLGIIRVEVHAGNMASIEVLGERGGSVRVGNGRGSVAAIA